MKNHKLSLFEINMSNSLLIAVIAIGYIAGLFVIMPDNDSANHASIALNILESGNWFSLIDKGLPYLDKPHFQFWIVALCFKFLGVSTFAYKINSFLFTLLAFFSTYKLVSLLKDKQTGITAALILSTFCAYALSNVDVRMEAILTSAIIFAIWQGVLYIDKDKLVNLIFLTLGLGIAFGTKGWIGIMVPAFSLISYLLVQKNIKWMLSYRSLMVIVLFFLWISPVLYAYYVQFDLHPELVIRGTSHHSGVKFILWDQIFERMSGQLGTPGGKDYFFFLHTLLWALLPWGLMFYYFVISEISQLISKGKKLNLITGVTLPAIGLTTLALSFSQFKLPHYINVIFPLVAIFLAYRLSDKINPKELKTLGIIQKITVGCVLVLMVIINLLCLPPDFLVGYVIVLFSVLVFLFLLFVKTASLKNIINISLLCSSMIWITMNTCFYPHLLKYQAGNEIAEVLKHNKFDFRNVGTYHMDDHCYSFDIYSGKIAHPWTADSINQKLIAGKPVFVLVNQSTHLALQTDTLWSSKTILKHDDYRVTIVTSRFLNPTTRSQVLDKMYLEQLSFR